MPYLKPLTTALIICMSRQDLARLPATWISKTAATIKSMAAIPTIGMQLGSGTWDFKPSITYTGQWDNFSWGAQANGTVRMESQNKSGYRLGDLFQATAWGGYNIVPWLTANVRGVYTSQGSITGTYPGSQSDSTNPWFNTDGSPTSILKFGPMDYPQNSGGKYWDVGFGLSAAVPSGAFAGNTVRRGMAATGVHQRQRLPA